MKLIYDESEQFYSDFFFNFECLSKHIFLLAYLSQLYEIHDDDKLSLKS